MKLFNAPADLGMLGGVQLHSQVKRQFRAMELHKGQGKVHFRVQNKGPIPGTRGELDRRYNNTRLSLVNNNCLSIIHVLISRCQLKTFTIHTHIHYSLQPC